MRRQSSLVIGLVERWFLIFTLLFSTSPIIPLLRLVTDGAVLYEGDPLMQSIWFAIYLVTLFLIILRWKQFIYIATKDKLLLLIIGLAIVSALWSADPLFALRRSIALVGTSIFGIYLASRYSLKEQLQLLAWALGIAALLSLLFVIVPPHYGIENKGVYAGVWRGIYHHKNPLGHFMALSAVVFLLLTPRKSIYRWFSWAAFGFSSSLLLLSTAKNPLVTFLSILALLPICKSLRWHYSLRIPFLIAVVLLGGSVAIFCLSDTVTVLGALGKDTTFTGRTELWYLLLNMGLQHPLLGYGYSAFWRGWDGPSAIIWNSLFWQPNHAHNGLLQLWLDLGLVGVFLFTLSFIKASLKAVDWVRSTKTLEGFWPLVYLAFMFLCNVSDSLILSANNIIWILYVATTFSMSVQRKPERKTSYVETTMNKQGLAQDA